MMRQTPFIYTNMNLHKNCPEGSWWQILPSHSWEE